MRIFGRRLGSRSALSCHQVGRLLQSYLDGELDRRSAARVAGHLDDCRRCGLEAETYEAVKASLHRGADDPADESLTRLREFGARLAGGELDPDDLPTP
jgi:anti-sigma factor RsiW